MPSRVRVQFEGAVTHQEFIGHKAYVEDGWLILVKEDEDPTKREEANFQAWPSRLIKKVDQEVE